MFETVHIQYDTTRQCLPKTYIILSHSKTKEQNGHSAEPFIRRCISKIVQNYNKQLDINQPHAIFLYLLVTILYMVYYMNI